MPRAVSWSESDKGSLKRIEVRARGEISGPFRGISGKLLVKRRLSGQSTKTFDDRFDVPDRNHEALDAVTDRFAACARGDHGKAGGHGFELNESEPVGKGREDEHVGARHLLPHASCAEMPEAADEIRGAGKVFRTDLDAAGGTEFGGRTEFPGDFHEDMETFHQAQRAGEKDPQGPTPGCAPRPGGTSREERRRNDDHAVARKARRGKGLLRVKGMDHDARRLRAFPPRTFPE